MKHSEIYQDFLKTLQTYSLKTGCLYSLHHHCSDFLNSVLTPLQPTLLRVKLHSFPPFYYSCFVVTHNLFLVCIYKSTIFLNEYGVNGN